MAYLYIVSYVYSSIFHRFPFLNVLVSFERGWGPWDYIWKSGVGFTLFYFTNLFVEILGRKGSGTMIFIVSWCYGGVGYGYFYFILAGLLPPLVAPHGDQEVSAFFLQEGWQSSTIWAPKVPNLFWQKSEKSGCSLGSCSWRVVHAPTCGYVDIFWIVNIQIRSVCV